MKTIILYASKYGATKEVANIICNGLSDAKVMNIKDFNEDILEYQNIILGSKITAGQIDKGIKELYHTIDSKTQQVSIFIVGLQKDQLVTVIEQNISKEAITTSYFVGGKLNFPKMNIAEKLIIKMINKKAKFINNIDTKKEYDFLDYKEIDNLISNVKKRC